MKCISIAATASSIDTPKPSNVLTKRSASPSESGPAQGEHLWVGDSAEPLPCLNLQLGARKIQVDSHSLSTSDSFTNSSRNFRYFRMVLSPHRFLWSPTSSLSGPVSVQFRYHTDCDSTKEYDRRNLYGLRVSVLLCTSTRYLSNTD